jgi:WXG100 family type VII secretion target
MASSVSRRIDDVEAALGELDAQISQLAGLWTGAASEGFQRTIGQWRSAAGDLRERLVFAQRFVTTAHDNHAGAVRANTIMWRV